MPDTPPGPATTWTVTREQLIAAIPASVAGPESAPVLADAILSQLTPDDEPLFDPDCRDGKHGSCVGGPCECGCHEAPDWLTFTAGGGGVPSAPATTGGDHE